VTSFSQPARSCARVAHSEKVIAFPPSSMRPKCFRCRSRDLPYPEECRFRACDRQDSADNACSCRQNKAILNGACLPPESTDQLTVTCHQRDCVLTDLQQAPSERQTRTTGHSGTRNWSHSYDSKVYCGRVIITPRIQNKYP